MALTNQHIQQPGWTNLSEGRPRITSRPCSRHTTRRAVNVTYRLSNTNIARSNSLTVVGSAAAGALPMPSDKGRNYANAKPAAFPWSLLSSPYDKDISSVALPALLGGMLEPFINAFNAGRACPGHTCPRVRLAVRARWPATAHIVAPIRFG